MSSAPEGLENWVEVKELDATYAEMQTYCEMRRLLPLYAGQLRRLVGGADAAALQMLDDLDKVIKGLPSAGHMLDGRYVEDMEESIAAAAAKGHPTYLDRPWVWRYNGAYSAFSETNVFSRS